MLKIYCDKCGAPSLYSTQKPNFCTSCGNCFNKSLVKTRSQAVDDLEKDDDHEDIDFVPNMSHLELDISLSKKKSEKISDLIGTGGSNQSTFTRDLDSSAPKEDVIKNFQKEAGAIRPRSRKHSNNVK